MKYDSTYSATIATKEPLKLFALIEKTVLAQTDDTNPLATFFATWSDLLSFHQDKLSNAQYDTEFTTKVDIALAPGYTFIQPVLLEHFVLHDKEFQKTPASTGQPRKYNDLTASEKDAAEAAFQEKLLAHIFFCNSGEQHASTKTGYKEDYKKGNDYYPVTRQRALEILDTFIEKTPSAAVSQGNSFSQNAVKCLTCGRRGHIASDCRSGLKCTYCGKQGHLVATCRGLAPKPQTAPAQSVPDTASVKSGKNKSDTLSIKSGKSKSSLKAFAEYLASQDDDADLTDDYGDKGEAHAQYSFVQSSTAYIFKQDNSHRLDFRKVILLDD